MESRLYPIREERLKVGEGARRVLVNLSIYLVMGFLLVSTFTLLPIGRIERAAQIYPNPMTGSHLEEDLVPLGVLG